MIEEQYPVDWWFYEEPYPGPDFIDPFEDFKAAWQTISRQVMQVVDDITFSYEQIVKDVAKALGWSENPGLANRHNLQPRSDVDKPAGMNTRNWHGPYEGTGYTRRGRKRY